MQYYRDKINYCRLLLRETFSCCPHVTRKLMFADSAVKRVSITIDSPKWVGMIVLIMILKFIWFQENLFPEPALEPGPSTRRQQVWVILFESLNFLVSGHCLACSVKFTRQRCLATQLLGLRSQATTENAPMFISISLPLLSISWHELLLVLANVRSTVCPNKRMKLAEKDLSEYGE